MSDSEYEQPSSVYQEVLQFVEDAQQNEEERKDDEIKVIKKNHKELQEEFQLIIEMIHDLGVRHASDHEEPKDEYYSFASEDIPEFEEEEEEKQAVSPYIPDTREMVPVMQADEDDRYNDFVRQVQSRFLADNKDITRLCSSEPDASTGLVLMHAIYYFASILLNSMPLVQRDRQTFKNLIRQAFTYVTENNPGLFRRLGQARQSGKRAAASI
jgi:hypothetical protein